MKKLLSIVCLVFVFMIGCKTANVTNGKPVLIERPERMFWEIKGPHNSIYIQGTVHTGSDKMYPLDEEVLKAFENSKVVYAEISSEDLPKIESKVLGLIMSSIVVDAEKRIDAHITKKEKKLLIDRLGEATYNKLNRFEPWIMNMGITEVESQKFGMNVKKGIDMFFYDLAEKQEKEVLGLDEMKTQLEILTFGTIEEQIYMLKETIKSLDDGSYYDQLKDIIDAYITNKKEKLLSVINTSLDYESEAPEMIALETKYYNALILDRNTKWADTFAKLLKKRKDVFIFAGSAHFLGDDSVFQIMKKNGTLELE